MLLNLEGYKILLASKSPRRQSLMRDLDIDFNIADNIEVEESYPTTLDTDEIPAYLSKLKADAYIPTLGDNTILITADTVVISMGKVLGKPADRQEAFEMLKQLSGKTHDVVTGVTLTTNSKQTTFTSKTQVTFAQLSDEEIDYYIQHYKPLDKAGAYGIQEWIGCIAVESINGSFYNVMGLPLQRLYTELKRFI